ncbi:DUF6602 domain-containing protein [Roseivirga pacifica]
MGNRVIQSILNEKIKSFRYSFEKTSVESYWDEEKKGLIHPGEFGAYREKVTKDFLRFMIPRRLDIGDGFLVTDQNQVSTQCDIIVYDRNNTPLLENSDNQKFYPVETVCAIGEVKSDLSKSELKTALNKLSRNKILRENISNPSVIKREHQGNFSPETYPYDHMFSFLICKRLNFDFMNIQNEIDDLYESDIQPWQKHNLIISVTDGTLTYYDEKDKVFMYPYLRGVSLKSRLILPDVNPEHHLHMIASYVFMALSSASIYYPELTTYLSDLLSGGKKLDQK